MNPLHLLLILLTIFYGAVTLGLVFGIRRLRFEKCRQRPFVSVLVAARNEEQNIGNLLHSLQQQTYPSFEVLVVNDRSTDRTGQVIDSICKSDARVKRVEIRDASPDMPSKKNALARGIAESRGEILCFTDADCLPPPGWLEQLVAAFDDTVGLVAGYSPYDASLLPGASYRRGTLNTVFQTFLAFEEFKGAIWSAGAIGLRRGWLCTGRNLAYRRAVYEKVGGFERIKHSISGDDDLFLQLVRRETAWRIRYVTDPASYVPTVPPSTFAAFVQQRTRHFSAGKFFPVSMKLFFLLFHAANLFLLVSMIAALAPDEAPLPIWTYAAKIVADSFLFLRAAPVFGAWMFAPSFIFLEILYILYNTLIGPLGFLKRFDWKPENRS